MTESDLVIFAVPLYVNNISSQMQIFMERTLPLCKIDFEKGRSGVYQHKQARKVPPLIFFGSCNLPDRHIWILYPFTPIELQMLGIQR